MHHHTHEKKEHSSEHSASNAPNVSMAPVYHAEDFWLELNPSSPLDEPDILPPIRPMPAPEERVAREQWDDVPPMDR